MGNCMMKTLGSRPHLEEEEEEEEIGEAASTDYKKENEGKTSSIKVKIVLTKEELDLLLVKLKNKGNGGKSLEEILGEIEKARSEKLDSSWKPSLESIMEDDDVINS
ncbi:hypothetical protein E1A91_A12G257700v1 [Gossypium mustelinum]|uniref:Uncharacterized protein n=2 Tax=Gossypium TaxID=3633 RepID=A0A5D2WYU0_GOSMU|nr:hypothetical protein ES332_A12G269500v1 [Gossypium tomentosum]TYJ06766.1 hypothetical protein E1A91_A12G257700v1 [Gossypium mustelinum]